MKNLNKIVSIAFILTCGASSAFGFQVPGTFAACEKIFSSSGSPEHEMRLVEVNKNGRFIISDLENNLLVNEKYLDFHELIGAELDDVRPSFAGYGSLYDIQEAFLANISESDNDATNSESLIMGLDKTSKFVIFYNPNLKSARHLTGLYKNGTCNL